MTTGILNTLGGLGVFLLGMVVMTDGLKAIAGKALRQALAKFTKSPTSGAITGAIGTAIIQSSSATTVAAVGFVGAGLITFSQSLGIIFGANIGTTITGWLVAIVGFKMNIDSVALPFVLVGVLLRLFSRNRMAAVGLSLAGFGLVFIGIDLMQAGMAGLEGKVTPAAFPGDHFGGRLLLVLLGILITLVTQSSSAGVATALAAVNAGTISFSQAAVMVIGMDVGTTVTAAMATLGGSTDVRRTGYAHVIYNLFTGLVAFALVTPYTWTCSWLFPVGFEANPEIALVGFHSFFNTMGVIAVLPLTKAFARLMSWLVPDSPIKHTQRLDRSLYQSPLVAFDAVSATLIELTEVVLQGLVSIIETGPTDEVNHALVDANEALNQTRDYLAPIESTINQPALFSRKISAIHTIDHLRRLVDRCQELNRAQRARESELAPLGNTLLTTTREALNQLASIQSGPPEPFPEPSPAGSNLKQVWEEFENRAEHYRHELIASAADGSSDAYSTIGKLDTLRWIRRVSYHIWRIMHHLSSELEESAAAPPEMLPSESRSEPPPPQA